MQIKKREEVTKQGFCKTLKKSPSSGKSLIRILFVHSSGWGGGECLFEFDWEKEGVGAYLRLEAY